MYRCVLSTIAMHNSWSLDPAKDNTVQLRRGDIVKKIKQTRNTVVCQIYRDNIKASIAIKEDSFKRNFKKI